ncbi:MAG TPA: aminotransferase class V-fold PLP-dependent enzyme [Candidatus Poseidoniales archaeon]|nr:aminotransferase class V-fold PLP-dependent enzyme [Candidatus Poseidoniales archaeon]
MSDGLSEIFLIPGPVRMSEATLKAMSAPAMTARSNEFRAHMRRLNRGLRHAFGLTPSPENMEHTSAFGEDGYAVLAVSGSGTAAMEMIFANRMGPEDRVLVPSNGKFGERVAQIAERFGKVEHLLYEWDQTFNLEEIDRILAAGSHTMLAICHNETSSGIAQDAAALSHIAQEHDVEFILDGITSIGGMPAPLAEWKVAAAAMGAQKCTAGPSGMAAIAISDGFAERCRGEVTKSFYFDLEDAIKKARDEQTPWTPAINLIIGWAVALEELMEEGLEGRHARCRCLAQGVRDLMSEVGLELYAPYGSQSDTVTSIKIPEGLDDKWRSNLATSHQVHVIGGQDHLKGRIFRIGSMGLTTPEEMTEGCHRIIADLHERGIVTKMPEITAARFAIPT